MVALDRWRTPRRNRRPGGRPRRESDRPRAARRGRCRALRPRPHPARPGRPLARPASPRRQPFRPRHRRRFHPRLRTPDARRHALESFAFGITTPTRAGLAPGCTFITLVTNCSASTGEITRVRLCSPSCPLNTASFGEGRKISITRSFSPALANHTTSSSSSLSAFLKGANDKVNIGFIGIGQMGSGNIGYAAKVPGFQIAAVCDVYQPALERAQAQSKRLGFEGVKAVKDFREILADKSIDAVCISTPDHWHPYMTVEACKAGKDVYVEKPSFVFIDEGPKMVEAARKYKRVVQAGAMQRSGKFFQKAREIVKSGELGDIVFCRTFQAGTTKKEGWGNPPDTDPPKGLDWDLWLV